MADEFRHKDVGTALSQAEWEAIGGHILNSQATDDMVYASSATQLTRLAVVASRIIGKKATGGLAAMTVAELLTLIGVEAGATADLTGDEIVTLLEALAGAARLSHTKISDIGATDHHTAAMLQSLLTTKGDVIARTSSVPVRIGIGANDEVLTADSAQTAGVKWAAAAGGVDTSGTPVTNDIARFTDADTIEGRSYAEFKADLDLEIGTDMLAQQTIGIADNNLLEVDHVSPADNDYAKFTVNGLEGRSFAEVRTDINVANGADVTADNVPQSHGIAQHTNVTRELFLPANEGYIYTGTPEQTWDYAVARGDANVVEPQVYFTFKCPDDFVSFVSMKIVWVSPGTGDMVCDLDCDYATDGESGSTHAEAPADSTITSAGANLINIDEPANSLTFSALTKDDMIGILFARRGTAGGDTLDDVVRFLGLIFTYTAEQ